MNTPTHVARGVAGLAAAAAAVATLCDLNHVHTGTLAYPVSAWLGQPWWTFPSFFGAFVVMALGYVGVVPRLPRSHTRESVSTGSARAFVEALVLFALAYLCSGFANAEPALAAVVLYSSFALRLAFTYERRLALGLAVVLAVAGMAVEGGMSAAGLVAYRAPEVWGVPWWLGAVYAHGALALREGMRALVFRD